MALAKDLMGLGIPAAAASGMGGQYAALTASGSTLANSTAVTASNCVVAGADGTKGVTLPAVGVGEEVWIFNNSGSTLKVWPNSGAAISVAGTGLGSANAAFSHTTYATQIYRCVTSTQWLAIKSA